MHLGDLTLPKNRAVRLTDRPAMTIAVYRGRKAMTNDNNSSDFCSYHKSPHHRKVINDYYNGSTSILLGRGAINISVSARKVIQNNKHFN